MATTARLPDELKHEADAYAARLGISLNALLAVALRDYLDARRQSQALLPAVQPPPAVRVEEAIHSLPPALSTIAEQAPARAVRVVSKPKPFEQPAVAAPLTRQQRRALERQAGKREPS